MHAPTKGAGPREPRSGLTNPSAVGGTSPVLTVFQAASSCCVGPGDPAAAAAASIRVRQLPEALSAARGDDANERRAAVT